MAAESEDIGFQFSIPEYDPGYSSAANVAIRMGALAGRLVSIERTRCIHPDGRAENDSEHSLMLSKVAPELAVMLYPELDDNLVARFASLHDDVEAYVGDTPTDALSDLDLSGKEAREQQGLRRLMVEYASFPRYLELIAAYESQSVPEARFVRAVDKLMVLLIQIPNDGVVLRAHYSKEKFLSDNDLIMERDRHKYGEFDTIIELRQELTVLLAERYLSDSTSAEPLDE